MTMLTTVSTEMPMTETVSKTVSNIPTKETWCHTYGPLHQHDQREQMRLFDGAANEERRMSIDLNIHTVEGSLYIGDKKLTSDGKDGLTQLLKGALATCPPSVYAEVAELLAQYIGRGKKPTVQIRELGTMVTSIQSESYRRIPASEFFRVSLEAITADMGDPIYIGGVGTINSSLSRYELPGIQQEVNAWMKEAKLSSMSVAPIVELYTSDCGKGSAQMRPYLRINGVITSFIAPVRVLHKGSNDWEEDVLEAENNLFAAFKSTAEQVAWLSGQELAHPVEALSKVCAKIGVPVKYYKSASDKISFQFATEGEITALDCYLALCEAVEKAEGGKKTLRNLDVYNNASKAARIDWTDFDAV